MFGNFAIVVLAAQPKLQVWEKPISPGLVYRQEVDYATPRLTYILRWTPGSPTKIRAELGSGTVYEDNATKGREAISAMVSRTGAIAGVNADFFPYTGDPLGLMIRDGALYSAPYMVARSPLRTRGAFAWSDTGSYWPREPLRFESTLKVGTEAWAIDGWNQEADKNDLCIQTPVAGFSLAKVKPNCHVFVRVTGGQPVPNGKLEGEVVRIEADADRQPIEPGIIVLTGCGTSAAKLRNLTPGTRLTVSTKLDGLASKFDQQAVGGGPVLVRDGKVVPNMSDESFSQKDFVEKLHPRTAVGRAKNGDLLFVVVDGRQGMSAGISLPELAKWFVARGCTDALNLDGGGSSEMVIGGAIQNRPSDGAERPVANGLVFLGKPTRAAQGLTLFQDKADHFLVKDERGQPVPNSEVLWSCTSPQAWIDQGGTIHSVKGEPADIGAYCRGALLSGTQKRP